MEMNARLPEMNAYLFAGLAVLCWSTVATAFKLTLAQIDVFQLVFIASLISTLVLLAFVITKGEVTALWRGFSQYPALSILTAFLNPLGYYFVLFAAYDRLPAQVAQPINYTWAIVLTLMSILFLGQRMLKTDLIAAAVCYMGVILITRQGALSWSTPDGPGVLLALASTFIWAGYWIINIRDRRDPTITLCLNFLLATPIAGLLCAVFSSITDISIGGLAGAIYIGCFEMGVAFLCWSHALKLAANTSRVSNLIFLSPFFSLVLIHFVLGEQLHLTTLAGLMVITGGLLLQQWGASRQQIEFER